MVDGDMVVEMIVDGNGIVVAEGTNGLHLGDLVDMRSGRKLARVKDEEETKRNRQYSARTGMPASMGNGWGTMPRKCKKFKSADGKATQAVIGRSEGNECWTQGKAYCPQRE